MINDNQAAFRKFVRSLPGCNADDKAEWDESCPDGAIRYYEGDDPDGFAAEMQARYGFDVSETYADGFVRTNWQENRSFLIPAGLVGEVYGGNEWPLGS